MTARQPGSHTIDLWLRRELAERYTPVLREPLPEEWLKLLKPPPRQ